MLNFEILDSIFFTKLLFLVLALALLINFGLKRKTLNNDTIFVYFMFGIGVFIVTYFLRIVEISFGFAFGLFAIFSMLRYRTEVLSFREMTYLFLVIVIALLCAVSPLSLPELLLVVSLIAIIAVVLESPIAAAKYGQQHIRYEKIENIKPENKHLLLNDLRQRTGLDIHDVNIISIDLLQDSAMLNVIYCLPTENTQPFHAASMAQAPKSEH